MNQKHQFEKTKKKGEREPIKILQGTQYIAYEGYSTDRL